MGLVSSLDKFLNKINPFTRSELKLVLKDLIKQNKILERTVNTLSDGLLIVDDEGEIYRANAVITDWFSAEGKSILGKNLFDFVEMKRKKAVCLLDNDEITNIRKNNQKLKNERRTPNEQIIGESNFVIDKANRIVYY